MIDDLSTKLLLLDDEDRRLMRSAIELFLEESDCLAAFMGPPDGLNDLRELLAQVPIDSKEDSQIRPAESDARDRHNPASAAEASKAGAESIQAIWSTLGAYLRSSPVVTSYPYGEQLAGPSEEV